MSRTQLTFITTTEEERATALFHKLLINLICARVRVNRTHTHLFICSRLNLHL